MSMPSPFALADASIARTEGADQLGAPVAEDALEISTHEQAVNEPTAGHGVVDVVASHCPVLEVQERVLVHPVSEGATALLVEESTRRLPGGDLALPASRHTMDAEPIIDAGGDAHVDRAGRERPQPEPGWYDDLEIVGVRQKLENALGRIRQ